MITCEDIFTAYFQCRKNKRNTVNALKFETNYESECIQLYEDIISLKYEINRSIAFVVDKPVKREIFAADFRDRIVHHLVVNRLLPLMEPCLIHDSYACRVGRGTFFGIDRAKKFMRMVSENHTKEAWILKLDILHSINFRFSPLN